jgi:molybdenum cofactor cytidylyltransferase
MNAISILKRFYGNNEVHMEKRPTAGIVLAAGLSARLGRAKQLIDVGGRPMLARVLGAALSSALDAVVLVLGHEADGIRVALVEDLSDPRLRILQNPKYREGMSSSLRVGLLPLTDDFPSVMFLLGDQPFMDARTINLLLERFWSSDKDICIPVCRGRRGNPAVFSRRFYGEILKLTGDRGARDIIRANREQVLQVEIQDSRCFLDIDNEEDARRLTAPRRPSSSSK